MSNHGNITTGRTATEERALALLGANVPAEQVALACGVSASRISQLMSDSTFAEEVSKLKFAALQKHNARDDNYDKAEDKLLSQLHMVIPMVTRPMEIARLLSIVNAAKRRGASVSSESSSGATIIQLTLPSITVNKFKTNIHNQVISAGDQNLITVQSSQMKDMVGILDSPTEKSTNKLINDSSDPSIIDSI